MADENHLAILREGVKSWNKWRKGNPEKKPELYGANLRSANLRSANLRSANLRSANLRSANLRSAKLEGTKLISADLSDAELYGIKLGGANLRSAELYGVKLSGANLRSANLRSANLRSANLSRVQALGTNFGDATLTGACIEDWNINSQTNLKDVKCEYIYLKENKQDRVPHDPNKIFAPGEFTKRYQKILETVELYFGDGIDWQVFLASFQKLQEEEKLKVEHGDRPLSVVQTIENTGDGSFVIKVGVSPNRNKGEYEKSFWQEYQPMLEEAEEKYQLLLNAKEEQINDVRQHNTQLMRVIELQANQQINVYNNLNNQQGEKNMNQQKPGNTYHQSGNFAIGHNEGDISGGTFAGVYNEADQQDLTQAATEIQELLNQLQKTNGVTLESAQQQVAKDFATKSQNDPKLKDRFIKFGKFIGENSGKTVVSEAVKGVIKLFLLIA